MIETGILEVYLSVFDKKGVNLTLIVGVIKFTLKQLT